MSGPLQGARVIEIGNIGPGPFAAMMRAAHGTDVLRAVRPDEPTDSVDTMLRNWAFWNF